MRNLLKMLRIGMLDRLTFFFVLAVAISFLWLIFSRDQSGSLLSDRVHKKVEAPKLEPKDVAKDIRGVIKRDYINQDGMIESEKNKTTSESQSYGLLIAVYSGDQEMFDRVWAWTKSHLQIRSEDKLFSWLWENGKVTDVNPATDADQDIAYALYLAHAKWGEEEYLMDAKDIASDIWNIEMKEIAGDRYVSAGNWATKGDGVVVNPSYLSPYIYRVFAEIDPERDWMSIVDSSYALLEKCSGKSGLARDWCKLNDDGSVIPGFLLGGKKKDFGVYSYDALRVPYRVALDYKISFDGRAKAYLDRQKILSKDWKLKGKIFAKYAVDSGKNIGTNESLASYGAQIASLSLSDKDAACGIFKKKSSPDLLKESDFYNLMWLWLGMEFLGDPISCD